MEQADMEMKASSFRAHYRQALSSFISCYITKEPWYFSIIYRVEKNDKTPTLAKALGLSAAGAIAVLRLAGMLVVKTKKQENTVVEFKTNSWKEFLKEEKLQDYIDFNIASVNRNKFYFLSVGTRRLSRCLCLLFQESSTKLQTVQRSHTSCSSNSSEYVWARLRYWYLAHWVAIKLNKN
jgi:hypothetical protein